MANLLGMIVTWVTFPGVILHEWAHKFFCDRAGVPVYEVKYFSFGNPAGYVRHGEINRYRDLFLITTAPFLINSLFAIGMFAIRALNLNSYLNIVLLWLGISFALHAFPSYADAKQLGVRSNRIWEQHPIALIGFPVVIVIVLANLLKFLWFDLIYALLLLMATFALVGAFMVAGSTLTGASDSVSGYAYEKDHTLWSNTGSDFTDYPIMYVVHRGTGVDQWNNVYLKGHSLRWPNDILFTDASGAPLSYWIENYTDDTAKVWVKVNTISTKDSIIKLYYGKLVDHSASNGTTTFTFFEDFDTLDTTRWSVTGSPTVADGRLILRSTGGEQGITSVQGVGEDLAVRALVKSGHFNSAANAEWFGLQDPSHDNIITSYYSNADKASNGKYVQGSGPYSPTNGVRGWKPDQYMVQDISLKNISTGTSIDCEVNDLNGVGFTVLNSKVDSRIVATAKLPNSRLDVDWVLIHKTAQYPPVYADWSKEKWLAWGG